MKKYLCVLKNVLVDVLTGLLDKLLCALIKKLTALETRLARLIESRKAPAESQGDTSDSTTG